MERIYFDNSATTPVDKEVAKIMLEYLTDRFGNPSSIHFFGREAKKALNEAREKVAALIGADTDEIIFTSCGTESDNLAIKGVALKNRNDRNNRNHIITTAIEHHAVMHTCEYLEQNGFKVTYLPVDESGMISLEDLEKAITDQTILITIMFANNEVGTVQPIKDIGRIARERGIYFHTDAVQAIGNYPIDVKELNIDLLTLSGHKIYASKGVGALYVRKGVKIEAIQHGGAHERNLRAGTENLPGIAGLGVAAELAKNNLTSHITHLKTLREKLISGINEKIPFVKFNGHSENHVPGIINYSFMYIEGESLLLNLDLKGIAASSGSACTSGSLDPSHVLLAMGLSHELAHGSLRVSLGRYNTEAEVDYFLSVMPGIIERLRSMSPLYGSTNLRISNPCNMCESHAHA